MYEIIWTFITCRHLHNNINIKIYTTNMVFIFITKIKQTERLYNCKDINKTL